MPSVRCTADGAPHLAGLRHLDVYRSELDAQAAVALVNRLRDPEYLDLSWNDVGDAGAAAIAARRDWTRLRVLVLRRGGISDDGAVALAAAPQLAHLESLSIDDNKLGERGWRALVESPTLAPLVTDEWRRGLALHDATLGPADAAREVARDLAIELSRGGCMVSCPVYSVTLRADGGVVFRGESSVAHPGRAEAHVDPGRATTRVCGPPGVITLRPCARSGVGGERDTLYTCG